MDNITTSLERIELNSYLLLSGNPFPNSKFGQANYVIYVPPMNSSGDIYHITSYLMLAKHLKKIVPVVQLSFDGNNTMENLESKMNTYSQTQRSILFAKHVGFEKEFLTPIMLNGGTRTNARFASMHQALSENSKRKTENIFFIEQKLLTTLISYFFLEHGHADTVKILRTSYASWSVNEKMDQTIQELVEERIKSLPTKKPLIILQYRYSSKANENQNIEPFEILIRLEEYLKLKGFTTWYLLVDSRSRKPRTIGQIPNKTDCFSTKINLDGHEKLFHLQFLLQLLEFKELKGIIGNTSGCLDLAAFIGHNVLNLHQFYNEFNYQSYRIFLQSSFLTVESFNADAIKDVFQDPKKDRIGFTDTIMKKMLPLVVQWLMESNNSPKFPGKLINSVQQAKTGKGHFKDLHRIIAFQKDELIERSMFINYVLIIHVFKIA